MFSRLNPVVQLVAVVTVFFLAGVLAEPLLFPSAGALPRARTAKLAKAKTPAQPVAASSEAAVVPPDEHAEAPAVEDQTTAAVAEPEPAPEPPAEASQDDDRGQDVDMLGESDAGYEVVDTGSGDAEPAPAEDAAAEDNGGVSDEPEPTGGE